VAVWGIQVLRARVQAPVPVLVPEQAPDLAVVLVQARAWASARRPVPPVVPPWFP